MGIPKTHNAIMHSLLHVIHMPSRHPKFAFMPFEPPTKTNTTLPIIAIKLQ